MQSWLMGKVCHGHEDIAAALGLTLWEYSGLVILFCGLLFLPVWLAWRIASRRFNVRGFGNGVWRGWIYVVGGCAVLQTATLLPVIGDLVPCPYNYGVPYGAALLAIFWLYVYHRLQGNAAGIGMFCTFVAGSIVAEITSLKPGIKLLQGGWEMLVSTFSHVAPLIRV
jgi:hypothetical protein